MTDSTAKEKSDGQMESYLPEYSKMEKETVLEFSNGLMVADILVNGKMGKRMDLAHIKMN